MEAPNKYGNEVCEDCHNTQHAVYTACTEACGRLLTWAAMNAKQSVDRKARESADAIRQANECPYKLEPDQGQSP